LFASSARTAALSVIIGTGPVWNRLFAIYRQLVSILTILPRQEQPMPSGITAESLRPGVSDALDRLNDKSIPSLHSEIVNQLGLDPRKGRKDLELLTERAHPWEP
jgi:hypothetical protein